MSTLTIGRVTCMGMLVLLLNFLLLPSLRAQDLLPTGGVWSQVSQRGNSGIRITQDDQGNIYAGSNFQNTFVLSGDTLLSQGSRDCVLMKIDPFGNLVWVTQIASAFSDVASDVKVDSQGNLFMVGTFSADLNFPAFPQSDSIAFTLSNGSNTAAVFIAKFSAQTGQFQWANKIERALSFSGSVATSGLVFSPQENQVYVAGPYQGDIVFNDDFSLEPNSNSDRGVYFARYEVDGSFLSAERIPEYQGLFTIESGPNGTIYLAGTRVGASDLSVSLLDQNLGVIAQNSVLPSSQSLDGVRLDYNLNNQFLAIVGRYRNEVDFGVRTLNSPDIFSFFVGRMNPNTLNYEWISNIENTESAFSEIALDSDDNGEIYIITSYSDQITVENLEGSPQNLSVVPSSNFDMFMAKYTSSGGLVDVVSYSNGQFLSAGEIMVNDSQHIIVSGTYFGDSDEIVFPALPSFNGFDAEGNFIVRLGDQPQVDSCQLLTAQAVQIGACDPSTIAFSASIEVDYQNLPDGGFIELNGHRFPIAASGNGPQSFTLEGLSANGEAQDLQIALFSAEFPLLQLCELTLPGAIQAPPACAAPCSISLEQVGTPVCSADTRSYSQSLLINYVSPPTSGSLIVNGQSFPIELSSGGSQEIILEGLVSDGLPVDLTAFFEVDSTCFLSLASAFTAPPGLVLENLGMPFCQAGTDVYSQSLEISYVGAPDSAQLLVNGQSFALLQANTGSQTITLSGFPLDGNPQDLAISLSTHPDCGLFIPEAFSAPDDCLDQLSLQPNQVEETLDFAASRTRTIQVQNLSDSEQVLCVEVVGAEIGNIGPIQYENPVFKPGNALEGRVIYEERFENGFPSDWEIALESGNPFWGLASESNVGNYAGTGDAAYTALGNEYEIELLSAPISVAGLKRGILEFSVNYQPDPGTFFGNPGDFSTEISTNGGASWIKLYETRTALGQDGMGPGEVLSLDISPYLNASVDSIQIKWRNSNGASRFTFDKYIQIDDIQIFEQNWLALDTNKITIPAGQSVEFPLELSAQHLLPGTYQAQVLVKTSQESGAAQGIPVTLHVNGQAQIRITPGALQAVLANNQSQTQTFTIQNEGESTLHYEIPDPGIEGLGNYESYDLGSIPRPDRICSTCSERENGWDVDPNWEVVNTNPKSGQQHLRVMGTGYAASPNIENFDNDTLYVSLDVDLITSEGDWFFYPWQPDGWAGPVFYLRYTTDSGWEASFLNAETLNFDQIIPIDFDTPEGYFNIRIIQYPNAMLDVFFENQKVLSGNVFLLATQFRIENFPNTEQGVMDIDNFYVESTPAPVGFNQLSKSSGSIAPGASDLISVQFSSEGLPAGLYQNPYLVQSNDPAQLSLEFPVSLEVVETQPQTGFKLINATLNQFVQELEQNTQINLFDYPRQKLSIEAEMPQDVGSVVLELSGTQERTQVDNEAPYALFGDNAGNYYPWSNIEPGFYSLTATPYSEANGQGSPGTPISVDFEVIAFFEPTFEFLILDTQDDSVLDTLKAGDIIDLNALGTGEIAIQALPSQTVGSVHFELMGPNTRSYTAPESPFYLFGYRSNGQIRDWRPRVGTYSLEVFAYSESFGRGISSTPYTLDFEIQNPVDFSYQLIDPATDLVIGPLQDGMNVDISQIGSSSLNIEAIPSNMVGSVQFTLIEPSARSFTRTENNPPYAVWGDQGGNFGAGAFLPGNYVLVSRAYNNNWLSGPIITEDTLRFTVINSQSLQISEEAGESIPLSATIELYPNPSPDRMLLKWQGGEPGDIRITLLDAKGIILHEERIKDAEELSIPIAPGRAGLHYLILEKGGEMHSFRVLIH